MSDPNQSPAGLSRQPTADVHGAADNVEVQEHITTTFVEVKHEKADESMAADGGTEFFVKLEPLDPAADRAEPCHNVYDSLFDVVKHEPELDPAAGGVPADCAPTPDTPSARERSDVGEGRRIFPCSYCAYSAVHKGYLLRHMLVHAVEQPHACQHCAFRGSTATSLKHHYLRKHSGDRPYSCQYCDYRGSTAAYLRIHTRTHTGERPYPCNYCDRKCSTAGSLRTHMRAHTGEKPYFCQYCDYRCSSAGNLKAHTRTHTGETPHSCTYCNFKCSTTGSLTLHIRTHTGEKPYSCEYCDFKSATSSYLKTHMRTHTGESPLYFCEYCDFKCSTASYLKHHTRSHTVQKPEKVSKS